MAITLAVADTVRQTVPRRWCYSQSDHDDSYWVPV